MPGHTQTYEGLHTADVTKFCRVGLDGVPITYTPEMGPSRPGPAKLAGKSTAVQHKHWLWGPPAWSPAKVIATAVGSPAHKAKHPSRVMPCCWVPPPTVPHTNQLRLTGAVGALSPFEWGFHVKLPICLCVFHTRRDGCV